MSPIQTILHPTDFSERSGHAFQLACSLARDQGARLIVLQTPAVRVMSTPVKTVGRDDDVFDTTRSLLESGVRRLPVVDEDDQLGGLVALDDLLRVLSRELSNLAASIRSEMEVK